MAFKLIVGLGNPGREYDGTRHNIGFEVVDLLTQGALWQSCRFADADMVKLETGVILLKPKSYMNLSGEVIRDTVHWLKWAVEELLVIVDDIALPLGQIRLREEGSSGGHNGLKSIESNLGTQAYARLRIGVGRGEGDLSDYVLGRFSKEERTAVQEIKQKSVNVIQECWKNGLQSAMALGNIKL